MIPLYATELVTTSRYMYILTRLNTIYVQVTRTMAFVGELLSAQKPRKAWVDEEHTAPLSGTE